MWAKAGPSPTPPLPLLGLNTPSCDTYIKSNIFFLEFLKFDSVISKLVSSLISLQNITRYYIPALNQMLGHPLWQKFMVRIVGATLLLLLKTRHNFLCSILYVRLGFQFSKKTQAQKLKVTCESFLLWLSCGFVVVNPKIRWIKPEK